MNEALQTPMMKQYLSWKEQYPNCLLFFRMGDFYETFLDDAKVVAKELDLTLTARDKDRQLPMAGVPWHSVESYLAKLTRKGYRVAICEQMTEPTGRTLVERKVVRVVTPGTYLSEEGEDQPQLAALVVGKKTWVLGWLMPCSSKISVFEADPQRVSQAMDALKISELLVPRGSIPAGLDKRFRCLELPRTQFEVGAGFHKLTSRWGLKNLRSFGLDDDDPRVAVAGALVTYLDETSLSRSGHLTGLWVVDDGAVLTLDSAALAHLDLIGDKGSLFDLLNQTSTVLGRRLLQEWILRPSLDLAIISRRQTAIDLLLEGRDQRGQLQELLKQVRDLDRALAKLHSPLASPRELAALRDTLAVYPKIEGCYPQLTQFLGLPPSSATAKLAQKLEQILVDQVPRLLGSGPLVASGVDQDLDEARAVHLDGEKWLDQLAESLKEELGLSRLKIAFNRVFGYGVEISKALLDGLSLPQRFVRRQTLVNAERFVIPELTSFEEKRNSAESEIRRIENRYFDELVALSRSYTRALQLLSAGLAELDLLCALAQVADQYGWVKPVVGELTLQLQGARHSLVEASLQGEPFVPFDLQMDRSRRVGLVTGPNMAGKSTFLRAVGVIQVLAQMGSFVPAQRAMVPLVDRIFTRVGARDELLRGNSTFMVEMTETANILNNATGRSLVILDEVGRGTSTYDGMSIAWAVVEYLCRLEDKGPLALFATHYHELTDLEGQEQGLFNLSMEVRPGLEGLCFTHRLQLGPANESYGVEVARLAGLPRRVILRAGELLVQLEGEKKVQPSAAPVLFDVEGDRLIDQIACLNPDELSPKEALELVYSLTVQAKELRRS